MIKTIKELYLKYKDPILYLFFGGCTTLVNIVFYYILEKLGFSTLISTSAAWFLSVLFAWITNRSFVFESRASGAKNIFKEACSFFACRAGTGLLDLSIMLVFVDLLNFNGMVIKLLSNILVIILNYILSKLLIFRKEKDNK